MPPRFVITVHGYMPPCELSSDGAWRAMISLSRGRLAYTITRQGLPGYAVHYDGNGKPPYAAAPPHLLSYGGRVRGE